MAERAGIEQIVTRAVTSALESHLPQLREALVQQVLREVQPQLGRFPGSGESSATDLLTAVSGIHAGTTQKEVLRALLDCMIRYSGRAALFVMKSGAATGWQGRGFADHAEVKDFSLDVTGGLALQVLESRAAISGSAAAMDAKFVSQFGAPAQDRVLLLPLRLKDKVAALVYADAGTDGNGKMDEAALELLVAATSAWLEVASLRKQAAKEGATEAGGERFEAPPVQTVTSYSDPFAGHAPIHAASAPAVAEEPAAVAAAEVVVAPAAMAAAAAPAPAPDAFAQMSVEDAEVHRKAQRFARLLMDEIKLYNQAKVSEGRKKKDLYDRLKEDIEKSRATYQKRYGNTVAAGADYFSKELIRSLAEDDLSLMGANFRQ